MISKNAYPHKNFKVFKIIKKMIMINIFTNAYFRNVNGLRLKNLVHFKIFHKKHLIIIIRRNIIIIIIISRSILRRNSNTRY